MLNIFTFLLVIMMAASGASASPPSPDRLKPSGRNDAFHAPADGSFTTYLAECRAMIAAARTDLDGPNPEWIIENNGPFQFPERAPEKGYRGGLLLVHGLWDSPYMVRAIGKRLGEQGYLVRSILLPGHGTRPGDALEMRRTEWYKAVTFGLDSFKKEGVSPLYMGGFSTGGALSVHAALTRNDLAGIILFAPGIGLKTPLAPLASLLRYVKPWLEGVTADSDTTKYESLSTNGAWQFWQVMNDNNRMLKKRKVNIPVFIAQSQNDSSVSAEATEAFFKRKVTSDKSVMYLYTPQIYTGPFKNPQRIGGRVIHRIPSADQAKRILDYSHISLPIPADDPHYGAKGDYRACMHYPEKSAQWRACKKGSADLYQGESATKNLRDHPYLRRLSYNPQWESMMQWLDRFLATTAP